MAQVAALARIEEIGGSMATSRTVERGRRERCGRSATTTGSRRRLVWELGPVLGRGVRHLRRASASSTSPRARATSPSAPPRPGAEVVASDLTPGELRGGPPRSPRPGRRAGVGGGRRGGAALRRRRVRRRHLVARRDLRARSPARSPTSSCASAGPGGTIGMLNFTPEGLAADFFGVFVPYMPPPPPDCVAAAPVGERGAREGAVRRRSRVTRDDSQ